MTETRRLEIRDYAQALCMMPHGGSVPGRMLLELLTENQELRETETVAVLRTPRLAENSERE
jgi:hypothetical protein